VKRFEAFCLGFLANLPGVVRAQDPDPASLSRLHDIALPPPVSWWPPATGWYWLGGVLLLILTLAFAGILRRYLANRYRRAALRESKQIPEARWPPAAASALLKRTAMAAWGRGKTAGLSGQVWVEWLNNRCEPAVFTGDSARLLAECAHDERQEISKPQIQELLGAVRLWIRDHRVNTR
jgi:hypothetical protein